MPLEISEIGVRLAVGGAPGPGGPAAAQGRPAPSPAPLSAAEIEEVVAACTQRVLDALRRTGER